MVNGEMFFSSNIFRTLEIFRGTSLKKAVIVGEKRSKNVSHLQ